MLRTLFTAARSFRTYRFSPIIGNCNAMYHHPVTQHTLITKQKNNISLKSIQESLGLAEISHEQINMLQQKILEEGKVLLFGEKARYDGVRIGYNDIFYPFDSNKILVTSYKPILDETGEKFWCKLIDEIYSNIEKSDLCKNDDFYLKHNFPLITYINDNKVFIINSPESAQHYVKYFKLNTSNDDDFDWGNVPPLGITMLSNNDTQKDIENDIDARKNAQLTLTGIGNCVVWLGKTGVGKSNHCNVSLGYNNKNGPFAVSSSAHSCTKHVSQYVGYERGDKEANQIVTVIDTPGFSDSDGEDGELLDLAFAFFQRLYYGPNLFILALDIDNPRFDSADGATVRILYKMFGQYFPKHLVIVFTKCDPNRKDGEFGWAEKYEKLKVEYSDVISKIMDGQRPLDVITVSAADPSSMKKLFDIIRNKHIGRYPSKNVQKYSYIKSEQEKKEMQRNFEQMLALTIKEMQENFNEQINKLQKQLDYEKSQNQQKAGGNCVVM